MTLWDQILCWQATETPTLMGLSEKGGRLCPRPQPGTKGTTGSKVVRERGEVSNTTRVPVLWKDLKVHPGGRRHRRPRDTAGFSLPQTGYKDQWSTKTASQAELQADPMIFSLPCLCPRVSPWEITKRKRNDFCLNHSHHSTEILAVLWKGFSSLFFSSTCSRRKSLQPLTQKLSMYFPLSDHLSAGRPEQGKMWKCRSQHGWIQPAWGQWHGGTRPPALRCLLGNRPHGENTACLYIQPELTQVLLTFLASLKRPPKPRSRGGTWAPEQVTLTGKSAHFSTVWSLWWAPQPPGGTWGERRRRMILGVCGHQMGWIRHTHYLSVAIMKCHRVA